MRRNPRRVVIVALAGLLFALCSCAPSQGSSSPPAAPSASATPLLHSVTPAALPSEPTTETAREARSPDPAFDYGFVVQITPTGFHPAILVAACCKPIVWINLTDRPNSVAFDVESGRSGSIVPGASWAFTPPNAESIAYHSATYPSMAGAIQVNQTTE